MAKSALCIGINDYPGTGMDLRGCVNDAQDGAQLPRGPGGAALRHLPPARGSGDLLLGGCQEGPGTFSYDAHVAGRFNGAFTHCALKALHALGAEATYAQWHRAITPALLPSVSYPQSPQLVGDAVARRARVFA